MTELRKAYIAAKAAGYASVNIDGDWYGVHYNYTSDRFSVTLNGQFFFYQENDLEG